MRAISHFETQIPRQDPIYLGDEKGLVELLKSLVARIQAFVEQNRHLIFWTSTAILFVAAPPIFLGGNAIGLCIAKADYFGLRKAEVLYLSWESSATVMGGVISLCGLLFHSLIPYFWGGIVAGSHLYRLSTGQAYRHLYSVAAIDHELHLVTEEAKNLLS